MLSNKYYLFLFPLLLWNSLTYSENLSSHPIEQDVVTKEFMRGYLQSKLEDRFPNQPIELDVNNEEVIFYRYPDDTQVCEQIQTYIQQNHGYNIVRFDTYYQPLEENVCNEPIAEEGSWLPELVPFFPTLLAEPHIVGYSAGYRSYDRVFRTDLLPVSIGDRFSLYQFKNIPYGRAYFGIEACVWAIFEAKPKSLALINADYYIGLPITYINDRFSARLRVYHQSSHLGDELLVENKHIHRLNPSMEVIDLYLSYDLIDRFTVFGGYSFVLRSDDSYKLKPNGISYGFNYMLDVFKIRCCNLEATPYVATYFSNWESNRWKTDCSVALGYQWDKLYGHKMRLYVEGHDGFSPDGQFSRQRTKYVAIKLLYGY